MKKGWNAPGAGLLCVAYKHVICGVSIVGPN